MKKIQMKQNQWINTSVVEISAAYKKLVKMFTMKINFIIVCTLIKLTVASEICDASVLLNAPASRQALDETFQRTSPLYGLSAISNEYLIRKQCHEHLQLFRNGVQQKLPWALKSECVNFEKYLIKKCEK